MQQDIKEQREKQKQKIKTILCSWIMLILNYKWPHFTLELFTSGMPSNKYIVIQQVIFMYLFVCIYMLIYISFKNVILYKYMSKNHLYLDYFD